MSPITRREREVSGCLPCAISGQSCSSTHIRCSGVLLKGRMVMGRIVLLCVSKSLEENTLKVFYMKKSLVFEEMGMFDLIRQ